MHCLREARSFRTVLVLYNFFEERQEIIRCGRRDVAAILAVILSNRTAQCNTCFMISPTATLRLILRAQPTACFEYDELYPRTRAGPLKRSLTQGFDRCFLAV
jgi:hypothetical protein